MPPQHPLTTSDIHGAASVKLPARMRFHALRAPVAAGLGAAAVGAMLAPAVHQTPQSALPETPQTPPAVTTGSLFDDSTAASSMDNNDTLALTEIPSESAVQQPVKKPTTQKVQATHETTHIAEEQPDTTATPPPVVVKKVVRHSNRTVVIKDSNNR